MDWHDGFPQMVFRILSRTHSGTWIVFVHPFNTNRTDPTICTIDTNCGRRNAYIPDANVGVGETNTGFTNTNPDSKTQKSNTEYDENHNTTSVKQFGHSKTNNSRIQHFSA